MYVLYIKLIFIVNIIFESFPIAHLLLAIASPPRVYIILKIINHKLYTMHVFETLIAAYIFETLED